MVLVERATRRAITNVAPPVDAGFTAADGVWTGTLPDYLGIANTAINWNGTRFAQILLPLPDDPVERRILLAHESFHRIQPALGFFGKEADNRHLDAKDARIATRLEIAALRAALTSSDWRAAARDALFYRARRLAAFADAEATESALIANEGIAEYTGIRIGAGDRADEFAIRRIDTATDLGSLIRSLGYVVGPAYGVLLDRSGRPWREAALNGRPLPVLLAESLAEVPGTPRADIDYGEKAIVAEETERERAAQERRAALTAAFVTGPVVTIPFVDMRIEFNPGTLFALGDQGTVYRTGTIRDVWGTLSVTGNVLLDANWSMARVPGPANVASDAVTGPGWSLTLAPGYGLVADARPGDQRLVKR